MPLEEVAAIFGDADEVAVYQREIEIDETTHTVISHRAEPEKPEATKAIETV